MERADQTRFNAQACQEACEWFVEFRTGKPDGAARAAFLTWLQQSPQNMGAYLQVTAMWNESADLHVANKWSVEALIEQAAGDRDNIVALSVPVSETSTSSPAEAKKGRPWLRTGAIAASVMIVVACVSAWMINQRGLYATAIGEQRFIALPDGSTINLNARSRIRVHYTEHERAIELQEGQALFEVARNPDRPFTVTSGDTKVRAVGTQFDVYHKSAGTTVTVIEGRVAITPLKTAAVVDATPSLVDAGEQLTVTPTAVSKAIPTNVAVATAWTQRRLVFENTPLMDVAEQFNRYNARQLVIRDASLNSFEIDGVFSSTDPASLIRFLSSRPGIRITEADGEISIATP